MRNAPYFSLHLKSGLMTDLLTGRERLPEGVEGCP
jgi:hypothetical protein